jgi:transposase
MTKVRRKNEIGKDREFKVVNINAAGVDVSPKEMQVCVPSDRDEKCNRTFGVYTKDLREISAWLKQCGIETVVMESTGVYWLPLFRTLKSDGFEVMLVNPREAKNYAGKKTDEADAHWLMMLHTYGLLKPCFQPDNVTREIRNLVRHRDNLIKSCSREVLHLQKEMEQMNLKLDNAFSDILGKSGQAIIKAILDGERDPWKLAELADWRCKKSKEEIAASLQATWDEDHLFIMKQCDDLYHYYKDLIKDVEAKIGVMVNKYSATVDASKAKSLERSKKQRQLHNDVTFDIERYAYGVWGVNVMQMPGMSKNSVLRLLAELGPDFVDKFPDARHFASWANLVPNNKISGGQLLSSKVPKKKNPVGQVFRQCANALWRSNEPLGDYFRHIKARSGHLQAMVATGKKMAVVFYTMVKNKKEYDVSIYAKSKEKTLAKRIKKLRAKILRIQNEQAQTGLKVTDGTE